MKKMMLFIVFALCVRSVNAEKVVGTYTMGKMSWEIQASIDSKGTLDVFVGVLGERDNDKVFINISGEENVNLFISALIYCKEKYIEWAKVAKDNNVTDYTKPFDVTFPKVEIYWRGSEWFSTYKKDHLNPSLFMVKKDGESAFITGGKAKHWDNEYIDQQWYLILTSVSEFDSLINALTPEKIKSELNKNENLGALFQ